MTRMRTVDAAVAILEKEGATEAFGLPGAAINPFYSAMRAHGGIRHTLARHVEGASHMADGYSRAADGNIGVCVGTSGPAGTDMITGLYASWADSVPILCITGQAPVAKLHKEDFQAVDIASVAAPLTKMAMTVLEPAQVPGAFQKAFALMRSGRPGPVLLDLPLDVQLAEIEFDIDTYEPLDADKPRATRKQAEKALDMLLASEHPLIVAGGGVINAGASAQLLELAELLDVPVVPTLMGWGVLPDDHPLMAGMVGIQTSHRYGNATFLESDFVIGIGNRWANRHTGDLDLYRQGRTFVHIDIEPTQIGRVFAPDLGIASDAGAALEQLLVVVKERRAAGQVPDYRAWVESCAARKGQLQRKTHFDNVPIKPQRVYEEMNRAFGEDTVYVSTIGLSQIAGAQMLHVYKPRHWINAGQAGPLGWTVPAALGVVRGRPDARVVALSGDYDFQFMIEELAVGAQFNLPYVHVVVNNSYLGLIRQSQRGFDMDYHVSLAFENVNSPETQGYGVDHVKVAEGLGCKAVRVTDPEQLADGLAEAGRLADEHRVPVVVEVILERITNIAMGSTLDNVTEFEDLAETRADAPTAITLLDLTVRLLIAPDKFKGSCSAQEVAQALVEGVHRAAGSHVDAHVVPVADGGEGTLEAAVHAGFQTRTVSVTGPTGRPVRADLAVRGREAVVELAQASGLAVLPGGGPDALHATSRGTGELVRAALDEGCERIVIGVGGSACTDAGAGLLQALGVRLLDREGRELPGGGAALARLARVELDGLDPRLADAELVLAGDVDNPLLGATGAAAVFGPQKGASPEQVDSLDAALSHFVTVLDKRVGDELVERTGKSARESSWSAGAGAAGGVGFAVLGVLGGTYRSGIEVVLELVGFTEALQGAGLVVTGEGSLDEQTLSGKAPVGIARAAAAVGVPAIAVCGRLDLDEPTWRAAGFRSVAALVDRAPDPETSMREARRLLVEVGEEIGAGLSRTTHETADRETMADGPLGGRES